MKDKILEVEVDGKLRRIKDRTGCIYGFYKVLNYAGYRYSAQQNIQYLWNVEHIETKERAIKANKSLDNHKSLAKGCKNYTEYKSKINEKRSRNYYKEDGNYKQSVMKNSLKNYYKNREKRKEQMRVYYEQNKEKLKEYGREYSRKRYTENMDKIQESMSKYRERKEAGLIKKNKRASQPRTELGIETLEKQLRQERESRRQLLKTDRKAYQRAYYQANREKCVEYTRKYRAKKKAEQLTAQENIGLWAKVKRTFAKWLDK